MKKVNNIMLTVGKVLRSPTGKKDYVVTHIGADDDVQLACVRNYTQRTTHVLRDWLLVEDEDQRLKKR